MHDDEKCPNCHGTGQKFDGKPCNTCEGTGKRVDEYLDPEDDPFLSASLTATTWHDT